MVETRRNLRVLHVEDHGILRETFPLLFRRDNRQIDVAENAEEALLMMRKADDCYDVVVTDFHLSERGENGLDLVRRIKRFYPKTQVILYTGWLNGTLPDWAEQNHFIAAFPKTQTEGLRSLLNQIQESI